MSIHIQKLSVFTGHMGQFGFSSLASQQGKGFPLCLEDVQVIVHRKRALLKPDSNLELLC